LFDKLAQMRPAPHFLLALANEGSDRLTVSQAAFFMLAATADAKGAPATRTQLLSSADFRPSLRNSYRQLLKPSRLYPNALGWLEAQLNPDDDREHLLRVTAQGRDVIETALAALVSQRHNP